VKLTINVDLLLRPRLILTIFTNQLRNSTVYIPVLVEAMVVVNGQLKENIGISGYI